MTLPNIGHAPARQCVIRELGIVEYLPTWRAMQDFNTARTSATDDELWFLQHPAVYTLGLSAHHVPFENPTNIPVVQCDRGGDLTYHAPGQLVAYVLIDLRRRGWSIKQLVNALEQSIIDFLMEHDIVAQRRPSAPGVYVDGRKIAQLGLRIRQGASYHGLSVNVDMDLGPFRTIAPCGIQGLEVTQLAALLPHSGSLMPLVTARLREHLLTQLDYNSADPRQ
jgi:lipoyl(octanoyl) transferase